VSEHTHRATTIWRRQTASFAYEDYNRAHEVHFGGGQIVPWSGAKEFKGDEDRVNPEEAFVAALSTCHMLTFLAIAARKRLAVDSYEDRAVGHMTKNEAGKLWLSHVILRPHVAFGGERKPSKEEMAEMHHLAHENCFIALSVKTDVTVEHEVGV
jgi:organic hydroperoxide reductase OsmC/OhrA